MANPSIIPGARPDVGPVPTVDIVVPVYNEERDLGPNVRRLHEHLSTR
ncbi:MAG TPA: glycosyltransferase family 2 protein, partial [Verrucomicrobiae bacterium]|nr:glycosyltransferase family 2 protein [Verrucomicrobiae bacterium]